VQRLNEAFDWALIVVGLIVLIPFLILSAMVVLGALWAKLVTIEAIDPDAEKIGGRR